MSRKNTPPSYGHSFGPSMTLVQWKMSSPMGPAEHDDGGSLHRSASSLVIRLVAAITGLQDEKAAHQGCGGRLPERPKGGGVPQTPCTCTCSFLSLFHRLIQVPAACARLALAMTALDVLYAGTTADEPFLSGTLLGEDANG